METPEIEVGIFSGEEISVTLKGQYKDTTGISFTDGVWRVRYNNNRIQMQKLEQEMEFESGLGLLPGNIHTSSFILHSVTIGVDFHWQRKEDQEFKGILKFIVENEKLTAINILSLEDYLVSVISSEMSASSSLELLKAHAVISRSWLLAQVEKSRSLGKGSKKYETNFRTDLEIIRWYDREDHHNFHVCADDHCQRYQGITRAFTPKVAQVIKDTYGEVLSYEGTICDARYSKCCGGISELFENVWEPVSHPYIQKVIDNPVLPDGFKTDLRNEEAVREWIMGRPDAFCNSSDKGVLIQVLTDYDQETNDFFRWKVTYSQREISKLVKSRTGIDFGNITELIPVERGTSGRLIRLKIIGTKKEIIIGKELEIRKALSQTHLYSSCFIVVKTISEGEPEFILYGAGWGHGVGLCQIGAAVMGSKGYSYREILAHYFKSAVIVKKYHINIL